MRVTRLPGNPIITPGMDPALGTNISGPSLIAVPPWLPNPLGRYYLYFAHHRGEFIRLAYADVLSGPWRIHRPGTLQLGDTACLEHVASPDVHVDHESRQIRMYFHGPPADGGAQQRTYLAVSRDGLCFTAAAQPLGRAYWRVFAWRGWWYALEPPGRLLRARDPAGPFEPGPTLFTGQRMRHCAVRVRDGRPFVAWSESRARPERLLACTIDLEPDWQQWRLSPIQPLLRPEHDWEGATLPIERSRRGAAWQPVHQLRDPAFFEEDGRTYLLYAVAGESGIAIAEVHGLEDGRWRALLRRAASRLRGSR